MKSLLLAGVAALALGSSAVMAQNTADPAAKTATSAAADGSFIAKQEIGTVRAPKLVGVAVYDSNNKDVGKIADLLLAKDGSVKAVVIGVGGFLGIGSKDVAVPYSAIHWQTEQRTVAVNSQAPANAPGTAPGADKPQTKTVDAAKTETYQGYPDRAVIDMTQAQLKAAPDFQYASNPDEPAGGAPAGGMATPAPSKTP